MIRLLSYNIHRAKGTDRVYDPDRIARVIADSAPHVVALQEVDVGRRRSGGVDQAALLGALLGMRSEFHPALEVRGERYGDAVLSPWPMRLRKAALLPALPGAWRAEARGALWVDVETGEGTVGILNTHLALDPRERLLQAQALIGPAWLDRATGPVALLGDFNAAPGSPVHRLFARTMTDAQAAMRPARPRATYPSRLPLMRIDHVFANAGLRVTRAETVRTKLARRASDHLPLLVEAEIVEPSASGGVAVAEA